MKTLRLFAVLCMLCGLAVSNGNAQSTSTKEVDMPFLVYIDCAGEYAYGTFTLHVVLTYNKKGNLNKAHFQPMGGYVVGELSGMVYRATGVTQDKGSDPYSYINLFHMVGNGIQYFVRLNYHYTILPDGEVKVVVDKSEVICK